MTAPTEMKTPWDGYINDYRCGLHVGDRVGAMFNIPGGRKVERIGTIWGWMWRGRSWTKHDGLPALHLIAEVEFEKVSGGGSYFRSFDVQHLRRVESGP